MKDNMPSGRTNMSEVKVKGVVIPLHATFEKLAALWLVFRQLGGRVPVASYSSTDPKDPALAEYRNKGYHLLDVGENKYQSRKTGSAVETVCRDFKVTDQILSSLVAVANLNNQTGYLKGYSPANDASLGEDWTFEVRYGHGPNKVERVSTRSSQANWSVVWLLREAYKVGIDINQVIKHVHSMLDAWYQVSTDNLDQSRWMRRVSQNGRICQLWKLFGNPRLTNGKGEFILPPFSVPWLVWSLAVMGDDQLKASSQRIEREVQWWISVQKAIVALRSQAKHWALEKTNPESIRRLRSSGHVFELQREPDITGGYFPANEVQARELWPQVADADPIDRLLGVIFGPKKVDGVSFGCLVIRHPRTKRVAIMAGKEPLNFGEVYARLTGLERQERGESKDHYTKVWHLDEKRQGTRKRHWLLNGSDNWPLPPTVLDVPTILGIVRQSARRFK